MFRKELKVVLARGNLLRLEKKELGGGTLSIRPKVLEESYCTRG